MARQDQARHRPRLSVPGPQGAVVGPVGRAPGRTGPGRELDPRGVPGRLPRARGGRPPVQRRARSASGPPASRPRKTLEEFDFDHQRSLKRDVIAHLGALDFVEAKENVVFLGPPGTGKTHLAIGLSIRACQAGHRVLFATAARVGRPPGAGPRRRAAPRRAHPARSLPAHRHRRGRLHPLRGRGGQPVLPAGLVPLRAGQRHRHLQQALRPLGRGVRRRRRGRRHDRPPRPPRRGRLHEGRQLPIEGPRPREGAYRRRCVTGGPGQGGQFSTGGRGSSFRAVLTNQQIVRRRRRTSP